MDLTGIGQQTAGVRAKEKIEDTYVRSDGDSIKVKTKYNNADVSIIFDS